MYIAGEIQTVPSLRFIVASVFIKIYSIFLYSSLFELQTNLIHVFKHTFINLIDNCEYVLVYYRAILSAFLILLFFKIILC